VTLAFGTTLSMGQTNAFHSGNPKIDEEIRQYEFQTFFHDLPAQIELLVLQRNVISLTLWVNGIPESRPNEPDKLAGLDLQVWLLRNDGSAVSFKEKPTLQKGPEPTTFSCQGGNNEYMDSMLYFFTKVPVKDLTGVVIRANGKLYCCQIDQKKWQK
jgi:hypothetical protein